jgi:hypothetical protein
LRWRSTKQVPASLTLPPSISTRFLRSLKCKRAS